MPSTVEMLVEVQNREGVRPLVKIMEEGRCEG